MSEAPIQLIIAAFQDEKGAEQALNEIKQAKRERLIGIQAAAIVWRDQKNKLHIKEPSDMGGGKGAAAGAVLGGVLGIMTGGLGLVAAGALGALIGGIVAKVRDSGISNDQLKELGDVLQPGTSAIVAVIEHKWVVELEEAMEEAGADVIRQAIKADLAAQLAAGRDVSYTAIADEDSLTTGRVAGGEDQVEMSQTVFTDEAIVHESAVANAEGIAAQQTVITDEGEFTEGIVATEDGAVYGAAAITDEGVTAGAVMIEAGEEAAEEIEEESSDDSSEEG